MIHSHDLIKKRILVVGSNGMLGQRIIHHFENKPKVELLASSAEEYSYVGNTSYTIVDLCRRESIKSLIYDFFPDVIINTAAFTNVDLCETERETAWKVNVRGVEYLAETARIIDAHLIHISTDYVFDGKNGPYTENSKPRPISYYGRTKLASENAIRLVSPLHTIIRTNVLYGPVKMGRPDFVKWVVTNLRENKPIRIVTDQINNPTYIDDIVQAIDTIIEFRKQGIFNIGGSEFLSRYDFTHRIADYFNLDKELIKPIVTSELNQPAPRPLKSGLVILKAETMLNYKPHSLNESFRKIKKELNL